MPDFVVVDQVALGVPDDKGNVNIYHHKRGSTVTLAAEVGASYVEEGALRPAPQPEPAPKSKG
jgi:hypothetical protein